MNRKQVLIAFGRHWHRLLVWPALLAILVFILSAFMHLLLTWTGPQTAVTRAPQQVFSADHLQQIPAILRKHQIREARIIKLIPSEQDMWLQVTEDPQSPRRYFNLQTQEERLGQDEQQARWLASYYLNDPLQKIASVQFQTKFDNDYPWVNRLLPVYKVVYEGEEGLTLYIHTETQALASISNHWKHRMQFLFRQLHTWQWLESFRHGRIILMMVFLSSLLGIILAGFSLLYGLIRQSGQKTDRRAHRVLAHLIGIPLLGFTASGIYHLLQGEYGAEQRDFNLAQPLVLDSALAAPVSFSAGDLHSVALISVGSQWYYRASVAGETPVSASEHDHHSDHGVRQQRFNGIPREQSSLYIPVGSATEVVMTDEQVARQLAMDYLKINAADIASVEKVSRFGPDYDFRNKRLPVWRVAVNNQAADVLFIDVASGLLVDRVNQASRMEAYSFSFLHKWNFLTFPLGREKRDALIALVLLGALVLAGLGVRLRMSSASKH